MSLYGLLTTPGAATPKTVAVREDGGGVWLIEASGKADWIALAQLRVAETPGESLRLTRGRRGWSLHLSGASARAMRELLPPPVSRLVRWRRWAARNPKLAILVIALPWLAIDQLSGTLLGPITTPAMAERLNAGAFEAMGANRCRSVAGQNALDRLATRLAPDIGGQVELLPVNQPYFLVAAIDGRRVIVMRAALTEMEPEALAGLVAHELAHIRDGDVADAIARGESGNYLTRLLTGPSRSRLAEANYTPDEEARADRQGIAMLRAAGIDTAPTAAFFRQAEDAQRSGRYFAQEYTAAHPGPANRAALWQSASTPAAPGLPRDDGDALFNLCAFQPIPDAMR